MKQQPKRLERNIKKSQTSVKPFYYSFKIFPRFWLVKTARINPHNQLLFSKFGENLRHIESMTSKVEPSENYWTIDVKMTLKVQPAADYWHVDGENLGTRLCYIWWVPVIVSLHQQLCNQESSMYVLDWSKLYNKHFVVQHDFLANPSVFRLVML